MITTRYSRLTDDELQIKLIKHQEIVNALNFEAQQRMPVLFERNIDEEYYRVPDETGIHYEYRRR